MFFYKKNSQIRVLTFCIMFRKIICFSMAPKNISKLEWKYRPYSFQTWANISGNFRKFPEILNFRKIYNASYDNKCTATFLWFTVHIKFNKEFGKRLCP